MPRPTNRVWMRVTSGQTAEEIIHNIAPPGQGERHMLALTKQDLVSQPDVAPQFLVIHEEELLRAQNAVSEVSELALVNTMQVCTFKHERIFQSPSSSSLSSFETTASNNSDLLANNNTHLHVPLSHVEGSQFAETSAPIEARQVVGLPQNEGERKY